ncbi:hypothetical protein [uncultured Chloroflexus sp.]|uniref:hypothetical protein n=1 Tax=uncultured Chloroflexus sp. TaxID=214040 RepID=UPI00261A44A1|nr:hypothetical protein [uncultured Chloroflexus sp.]
MTRQIVVTLLDRDVTSNRANPPPLPRNMGVMVINPTTLTAGSALAARGSGYSHDR